MERGWKDGRKEEEASIVKEKQEKHTVDLGNALSVLWV